MRRAYPPGLRTPSVEKPLLQLERGASQDQAVSRILSWVTIHLGGTLPCASCDRNPGASGEQPSNAPLFDLAPGGACRAGLSPGPLVSSYLTVSPLPAPRERGRWRSALCCAFPRVSPAGR